MPTYVYEITENGRPTGETFEAFQKMTEDAFTQSPDGRSCRRAVISPTVVVGKEGRSKRYRSDYRGVHRSERTKEGVYNPSAKGHPQVSLSMPPDPRKGVVRDGVRHHSDGTMTALNHQPIIRNESDRKRFCERLGVKHLKD